MANAYGSTDELAIASNVAAADHIPTTGVVAQTQALKGSHLTVGVSNTTSATYLNLLAYLSANGITTSGARADISIQTLGSPTNLITALNAGKIQAIANVPPTTVQSNSITIPFGRSKTESQEVIAVLDTTTSLIKAHPDTVQAVVTASIQGWQYVRTHPSAAIRFASPYFVAAGITSPEEIAYILDDQLRVVKTSPAVTRAGFNVARNVANLGAIQLSGSISGFVDNKFANTSIKQLGLDVPAGPLR
jgi:hypothetical protein